MKTFTKSILTFGLVVAASFTCIAASGGCGTDLHKAAIAAGSIAASLNTAAQVNHDNPYEDAPERQTVARLIVKMAVANDGFIGALNIAEQSGSKASTAGLAAAFANELAVFNELQTTGVLGIKNPQAQALFRDVIASIQVGVATIQSLYPQPTAHLDAPGNPFPLGMAAIAVGPVDLTPQEIEELIGLALAAGSALVPKLMALRGETDAEIIANASADDAAAEKLASEDGAPDPAPEPADPVLEPIEDSAAEPKPTT